MSNHKLLKKIKDPRFNIDELEHYSLSIQLGVRDFQVFIFDNNDRKALLLEDYIFEKETSIQERLQVLRQLFDSHHLLAAGFWKTITILIKNKKFSIVPEHYYQKEYVGSYLSLNTPYQRDSEISHSIIHQKAALVNIFAIDKEIYQFFNQIYPNRKLRYIHQSSPLINGALLAYRTAAQGGQEVNRKIVIYVDRFLLHVIIVSGGELNYYNQFPIKKLDDYVRYLKLVAAELGIDLQREETLVYGFLGKNTPHFQYLSQNIRNIKLGERPRGLNFGYVFDEIQDHQYFDLYSMYSA